MRNLGSCVIGLDKKNRILCTDGTEQEKEKGAGRWTLIMQAAAVYVQSLINPFPTISFSFLPQYALLMISCTMYVLFYPIPASSPLHLKVEQKLQVAYFAK